MPPAFWLSGTNQNSIPANDNALRMWITQADVNNETTAQPASPTDGDVYIIQSTHTGAQWANFIPMDVAIFSGGTWYAFSPVEGMTLSVSGGVFIFKDDAWVAASGGGGSSRTPAVQSITSAATVTPTFSDDLVKVTAQAAGLNLANPSGTAIDGIGIVIRIKDDGTARAITYGTQYRAIGVTLPATTVVSKTLYLAGIWNVEDATLDIVAVGVQA